MTNSTIQELIQLEFKIAEDGKHYKHTYYGDSRYLAALGESSSDNCNNVNITSIIIKI